MAGLQNIPIIRPHTYRTNMGPGAERGAPYWPSGNVHPMLDNTRLLDKKYEQERSRNEAINLRKMCEKRGVGGVGGLSKKDRDKCLAEAGWFIEDVERGILNPEQRCFLPSSKRAPISLYPFSSPESVPLLYRTPSLDGHLNRLLGKSEQIPRGPDAIVGPCGRSKTSLLVCFDGNRDLESGRGRYRNSFYESSGKWRIGESGLRSRSLNGSLENTGSSFSVVQPAYTTLKEEPVSHRSCKVAITDNGNAQGMHSKSCTFKIGAKHCQDRLNQSPVIMFQDYLVRQCGVPRRNVLCNNGNIYSENRDKRSEWDMSVGSARSEVSDVYKDCSSGRNGSGRSTNCSSSGRSGSFSARGSSNRGSGRS